MDRQEFPETYAMPKSAKKTVDLGALEGFLGFRLRLAQIRVFKDFEQGLAELGVTPANFSVLEVIRRNPGITQSKVAAAVHLDRSSVVPLLDKLEQRGLLNRQASTTDRRHNHIYLSAAGEELLEAAMARVLEHEARMSEPLSAAERKTLLALLEKFNARP